MTSRQRLDKRLVDLGLAESRQQAQRLIMAGLVLVDDQPASKPGMPVNDTASLRLKEKDFPWVSRGGVKLEHGLQLWQPPLTDAVCLDVGASTGGFTHVLLSHGVARVYAVDVGYGQLAWKLASDPRVISLERTNIRTIPPETIPEPVDFLTIDVSFISLSLVLPCAVAFLKSGGQGITLIKPQFEVGKGKVGKGGVVRDPLLHQEAIDAVLAAASRLGLQALGLAPSPILGPAGNQEFLFFFSL